MAVDIEQLLSTCCGIEDDGQSIRLYVAGPTPQPSTSRGPGRRTDLFRLFAGEQADAIRRHLATHPAWVGLRVARDEG